MALTSKQEIFCIEAVRQETYSDAFRIAYDTKNWTDKSVNEKASQMMADVKIKSRVKELKEKIQEKKLYTIEHSIKRDLSLIKRYESALDVLEDIDALEKDIEVAERTIKYISISGYNSAQDRLSKQNGFFEKNNEQKNITINWHEEKTYDPNV